jgi:hypothetical protein
MNFQVKEIEIFEMTEKREWTEKTALRANPA